ncbi:MAG: response regulator [Acidobacteria bacterium]|nr:response regulator [Acidobacteriota bacterium]
MIEALVIDDELSVADALRLILEDHGCHVVVVGKGHEGVEQARRQRFDVVITDLRLPDMSGLEVMATICREHPRAVLVLITAYGSPDITLEAVRCGAVGVLSKPFLPSELLAIIPSHD